MKAVWILGLVGAGAFGTVATSSGKGFLPYEDVRSITKGGAIYKEQCASCHGESLEGADNWREPDEAGMMPAPPHDATGHTWHHPDMALFKITKYGTAKVVGNGYESNMPGFEGTLSDQDIVDVLAYIKSTWPDRIVEMHNQRNN